MKNKRIVSFFTAAVIAAISLFSSAPVFAEENEENTLSVGAIVLFKGKPQAIVNNVKTLIDPMDSNVYVPIVKDRTFVPLRFISENLGAEVGYSDAEKKVSVNGEGAEISVVIGSDIMTVNGEDISLDSEAFIQSGRTFVPIRAISEAFGKKVFYDDRGIIIISEREVDEEADKAWIDSLAESMNKSAVPDGDGEFGENGIREVPLEKYFYNEKAIFRDYLHGNIRPDEGTMELTVNPLRPMSDMGNNYDFAMSVLTSQVTAGLSINIFCLYAPPRPDTGIIFMLKSKTSSQYLKLEDFDWQAGDKFNIACTWKAGDKMCLYKDGELAGSIEMGDGMTEDILPAVFNLDFTTPWNVRKIKLSTRAKEPDELDLNVDSDFSIDEDTAYVTGDGCTNPQKLTTKWHKESGYTNITPVWRASTQMFYEGENAYYPLVAVNHSGEEKTYTVKFDVKNDYGVDAGSSEVDITVPADDQYHVYEAFLPQLNTADYYKIRSDIYDGEEWLYGYDSAISVANEFNGISYGKMKDLFGLQIAPGQDFNMMRTLGMTMTRAMYEFRWSHIEQTKGEFTFDTSDMYVEQMQKLGFDTMAVLGYPPAWASLPPSDEKKAIGKKFSALPERWQPRDKEEWANYIRTVVSRYKGKVKYWEIYNEINFIFPYSAQTFSGTKEEYYELLKIAYTEAKKADPDCVVVLSGFSAPHVGAVDTKMPMEMIDDRFKEGYYDIFNVHGYLGESSFANEIEALKAKWPQMEYWMGEYMSFQLSGDVNRAVEYVKTNSDFAAAGYSKVISMGAEGSDPVLNLNATKSPTVSCHALAVMDEMIRKCDETIGKVPAFSKSDSMRIDHMFRRSDGKYVGMLSSYPAEYTLTIANPDAEVYNMYGSKADVEKAGTSTKALMTDILYIISDDPITITNAVGATSDNLLLNGKFEDCTGDSALGIDALKISNWTVNADGESRIVPSTDKRGGKYAAEIYNAEEKGKTFLSQKVDGFSPSEYKVSVRVKKPDPESKVIPYISMVNNDTGTEVIKKITKADTGDYEEISEVFTLPVKTKNGITFCFGAIGSDGKVLMDDAQVIEYSDGGAGGQNLLSNNGFEDSLTGWRTLLTGDPEGVISVGADSHSGTKSVAITSTGAGKIYVAQDITVDKPGTYKLTVYCKRISGSNVVPFFRLYDRNANKGSESTITTLLPYRFAKATYTLSVDDPNGTQLATFAGIQSGKGTVMFDDFVLEKID